MAAQWVEQDSKVHEPQIFNEEPSLQLFVSEDSKSASRKSIPLPSHDPSPRSDEPPSEIMLINSASSCQPSQMPQYKCLAPFHVSLTKILETFEKTSGNKNFQVIEKGGAIATAVHKNRLSVRELILCCFPKGSCELRSMTAIRLHIGVNEKRCTRTVLLKGLYGNEATIKAFIAAFRSRIEPLLTVSGEAQCRAPAQHDGQYEYLTSEKIVEEDENGFTIKNESASYYQFHKILSSESYTLGQTIANFVSSFVAQYRNVEESSLLLPQPMDSVKLLVEETVEALFSHFNFGKSNTERMMHYCRPAVEKFIFAKLLPQLLSIYRCKHKDVDEKFSKKRIALKEFGVRNLMNQLEIKQKLRLVDLSTPYREAIDVLAKLKDFITPVEKLNCLLTSVSAMKTAVVDYWHGKEELETMDDVLPVQILVLVLSCVETPMAEVSLLQDYIGQATRYENESQMLTNFEVSVRYIALEWDLPPQA